MSKDVDIALPVGHPMHETDALEDFADVEKTNLVWPVLLSLLVMLLIGLLTYEPGTFRGITETVNVWLLMAAVLCIVARTLLGGFRLRYISHNALSLSQSTRGQLFWDFASNITPSAIGGAPLTAVYISKNSRVPLGDATALMLFSMLLDQLWFAVSIAVIFAASFFISVYPEALGSIGAGIISVYFLGLMLWVALFAYCTLVKPELLERIAASVFRLKWLNRFHARVGREMGILRERASVLRSQPLRFFLTGFLFAAVTWIFRYLALLFIVWAVFEAVPKLEFLVRTAAMMASALIMPTPGGAGGIEGLYALFLAPLMPKVLVAPTLLTWRILAYYSFIAVGVLLTGYQVNQAVRARKQHVE